MKNLQLTPVMLEGKYDTSLASEVRPTAAKRLISNLDIVVSGGDVWYSHSFKVYHNEDLLITTDDIKEAIDTYNGINLLLY